MRWIATYISTSKPTVYRTIHEDCINEATRQAERWCPRGYILSTVKQKE